MNIYLFSKLINGKELSKPKSKGRNHKGKIDLIIKIFKHLCVKEKKTQYFHSLVWISHPLWLSVGTASNQ